MPEPEIGELYAVYFGTAFHLGVYIGQGEIVHYLNDNYVYRVTWEKFLDGRTPEHWPYPDLDPVPAEVVVRTALSEVGKTYPYDLLRFNCENFAIFCKSGGATYFSKYAQIAGGVSGGRDASGIRNGRRAQHSVRRMVGVSFRRTRRASTFRFRSGGLARP